MRSWLLTAPPSLPWHCRTEACLAGPEDERTIPFPSLFEPVHTLCFQCAAVRLHVRPYFDLLEGPSCLSRVRVVTRRLLAILHGLLIYAMRVRVRALFALPPNHAAGQCHPRSCLAPQLDKAANHPKCPGIVRTAYLKVLDTIAKFTVALVPQMD